MRGRNAQDREIQKRERKRKGKSFYNLILAGLDWEDVEREKETKSGIFRTARSNPRSRSSGDDIISSRRVWCSIALCVCVTGREEKRRLGIGRSESSEAKCDFQSRRTIQSVVLRDGWHYVWERRWGSASFVWHHWRSFCLPPLLLFFCNSNVFL